MTKVKSNKTNTSSVTFHKSGRFVKIKANDIYSADVIREIKGRHPVGWMRKQLFYDVPDAGTKALLEEERKIEIWRCLESGITSHPIIGILASYGIQVNLSDTLKNYMATELKRQQLENTPYPTPPVITDIPLFDRCSEGTVLRCIKDYGKTATKPPVFVKGNRYMVLTSGGDGRDVVTIATAEVSSKAQMNLLSNAAKHEWTQFDPGMEEHFDDSESLDLGKDITKLYKDRISLARKRLKAMKLPLYEHVEEDAVMMSQKRGVLNAYLMRMGKTSAAIAVAELAQSKKVCIVAPGNARLFWTKEFERLGFKENKHFTEIRSIDHLSNPAKYHMMTYTWIALGKDPAYKARKGWEGLLRPSSHLVRKQDPNVSWKSVAEVEVKLNNTCPHCKKALERPVKAPDGSIITNPDGKAMWTVRRGYICRTKTCKWKSETSILKGSAWATKKPTSHVGGYINYDLAKHADCEDVKPKGRMCTECNTADAVWTPPRYKRFAKKYTHIILDEAHATKDDTTATSTAALNLRGRRRQALTGTPMSNSAMDVYWPLHWAMGAPTTGFQYAGKDGEKEFDSRFCDAVYLEKPVGTETDTATGQVTQLTKTVRKRVPFLKNPPDFWKFMASKVIRRSYNDALFQKTLTANGRSMPEVDIRKISCPMDQDQAALMLASIKDFKGTFAKLQKEAEKKGIQVNPTLVISQMTTMRTTATCPELLNLKFGSNIYKGPEGGGKIPYIRGLVEEELKNNGKILILSDFRQMQQTCEKALKGLGTIRFSTNWDDDVRREAFTKFQEDPECKIFIAGTRAIREGVDLSAADTCICCDLLWSPAFQTQAWSRIMAPSTRKRTCKVYLMLSANSLDEHIFNIFYSKMIAAEQALDRKVLNRKAQSVDIKWFVERVVEEERALRTYLRDCPEDTMLISDLDLSQFENRFE